MCSIQTYQGHQPFKTQISIIRSIQSFRKFTQKYQQPIWNREVCEDEHGSQWGWPLCWFETCEIHGWKRNGIHGELVSK